MRDFRTLDVWKNGHELTLLVYLIASKVPTAERYGLTSQMRRCAASIPANIAEGCGRTGNAELHRFLQIAAGSASELHYFVILARDLGYVDAAGSERLLEQTDHLRRMLTALITKVAAARGRGASAGGLD